MQLNNTTHTSRHKQIKVTTSTGKYLIAICLLTLSQISFGQYTGINTQSPERALHVVGEENQFLRVETSTVGGQTGIELINWNIVAAQNDWRIANYNGSLWFDRSINNFISGNTNFMKLTANGNLGINTSSVLAPLHIGDGPEASNSGDGYLTLGSTAGLNMVFDSDEINARLNGNPYTLRFQQSGGVTEIGGGGGNVLIGNLGGNMGIGTTTTPTKLSIDGTTYHLALRNPSDGMNDWFIGASNANWAVGDNQLIFSPGAATSSSHLRLRSFSDNNGTFAPVQIVSSYGQTMLIDGNEIDCTNESLYINHNSNQNTYINANGGSVGVGAASASSTLTVETIPSEYAVRLENTANSVHWDLHPYPAIDKLGFHKNGTMLAQVDGASGAWIALSDQRMKNNIKPMEDVLDKVNSLGVYSYEFRNNKSGKRNIGPIAQELRQYFPELVTELDDIYSVSYSQLSVIALKALQEQQQEIDELTREIEALLLASNTK